MTTCVFLVASGEVCMSLCACTTACLYPSPSSSVYVRARKLHSHSAGPLLTYISNYDRDTIEVQEPHQSAGKPAGRASYGQLNQSTSQITPPPRPTRPVPAPLTL
jgi:hypothetical protein